MYPATFGADRSALVAIPNTVHCCRTLVRSLGRAAAEAGGTPAPPQDRTPALGFKVFLSIF